MKLPSKKAQPASTSRRPAGTKGEDWYPASVSIGLLMRVVLFGLRSAFKTTLSRRGVPRSAWPYLRVLYEVDGLSQRELTEQVGVMQPNTVGAIRTMKLKGLVRVEDDSDDRRGTRVWLTAKGKSLMQRLLPEVRGKVRGVALEGFTQRQEKQLHALLIKLCDNVRRNAPK